MGKTDTATRPVGSLKLRLVKEAVRFFAEDSGAVGTVTNCSSAPEECCLTHTGECCCGNPTISGGSSCVI